MRQFIQLQNPATGEIRKIKIGWAWPLFFFSSWFGLPLFLRGLAGWGTVFLALWLLAVLVSAMTGGDNFLAVILLLIQIGGSVWMAIKGNEITARHHLANGWRLLDRGSPATLFAKAKWNLPDAVLSEDQETTIYSASPKPALIAVGLSSIVVLLLAAATESGVDGLEVRQEGFFLTLKNVGYKPFRVEDVTINDRAECRPSAFSPRELKVGDVQIMGSPCATVVRITVKTNAGSGTYTFSQ